MCPREVSETDQAVLGDGTLAVAHLSSLTTYKGALTIHLDVVNGGGGDPAMT